jgi:hypothetical protein
VPDSESVDNRVRFMTSKIDGVYPARFTHTAQASRSSISITVQMLHRELLTAAVLLADREEPRAAVILAQSASEVQVEHALAALLRREGIADELHDRLTAFVTSYNMAPKNKRLVKLWKTLTGDEDLTQQPFWRGPLQDHMDRRNGVAHRGADVETDEARESIHTVLALMEHMEAIIATIFPATEPEPP